MPHECPKNLPAGMCAQLGGGHTPPTPTGLPAGMFEQLADTPTTQPSGLPAGLFEQLTDRPTPDTDLPVGMAEQLVAAQPDVPTDETDFGRRLREISERETAGRTRRFPEFDPTAVPPSSIGETLIGTPERVIPQALSATSEALSQIARTVPVPGVNRLANLLGSEPIRFREGTGFGELVRGSDPRDVGALFLEELERKNTLQQLGTQAVFDPLNVVPGLGIAGDLPLVGNVARGGRRFDFTPPPAITGPTVAPTVRQAEQVGVRGITETARPLVEPVTGPVRGIRQTAGPIPEAGPLPPTVQDTTTKLSELIKSVKRFPREEIEALRSAELGRRVGQAVGRLGEGPARQALRLSRRPLKGELPKAQFPSVEPQFTGDELEGLFQHIRTQPDQYFEKINTSDALEKVLAGQLPTRGEVALLERSFGTDLAKAVLAKRTGGTKVLEATVDIANIPRTLMTAWDASAPLRQGAVLAGGHPLRFGKNIVTMFKAMAREGSAEAIDQAIRSDVNFERFVARNAPGSQKNLFQAELGGVASGFNRAEEAFMSKFARRIPGIRQSERAYVTFLNKFRYDVMSDVVRGWEKGGKAATNQELDQLALFLNRATGRGGLGKLEDMAPILNIAFFSPRLLSSRLTLPLSLVARDVPRRVRQQVARDLAASVSTGIGILGIIKMSGLADVQVDPRSSDFGKIKVGNTRIEFWGGFQPIARYMAQLITNERRGLKSDKVEGLDFAGRSGRLDTITRFLRSKAGPPTSAAADVLLFREGFLGEDIAAPGKEGEFLGTTIPGVPREFYERLAPLFVQDMIEAVSLDGLTGGFKALPGGLGAGVSTFE